MVDLTIPMDSAQVEIVATLFACWNDLLGHGEQPEDERIIADFYAWSESKASYERERLQRALAWMREKGVVPTGRAKPTAATRESRQPREKPPTTRGRKGKRDAQA